LPAEAKIIQFRSGTFRNITASQLLPVNLALCGLVSGSWDESIKIWDLQKVINISHFAGQYDWVDSVVTYYTNGPLSEEATLTGHSHGVECIVTYHNNSKPYLASGSPDEKIILWNLMTRKLQSTLEGHSSYLTSLAFFRSGTNNFLASGSSDQTIKLWNLTDYTLVLTLSGIDSEVRSLLTFQEAESSKPYLISGHWDGEILMWSKYNNFWREIL